MSIFYITTNENSLEDFIEPIDTSDTTLVVNESSEILSLRIQNDEDVLETINELQDIILSESSDLMSKNDAYNELLLISNNKSKEENIENIIKDEFNNESFVKINGNNLTIVIDSDKHDYELANKIIRRINKEFSEEMYITIKFE